MEFIRANTVLVILTLDQRQINIFLSKTESCKLPLVSVSPRNTIMRGIYYEKSGTSWWEINLSSLHKKNCDTESKLLEISGQVEVAEGKEILLMITRFCYKNRIKKRIIIYLEAGVGIKKSYKTLAKIICHL